MTRRVGLWALLVLGGCGGASPGGDAVVVSDSAGVVRVWIGEGAWDDVPVMTPGETPVVSIGAVDGPEAQQLYQVADAKPVGDRLAVLNRGSGEIRTKAPPPRMAVGTLPFFKQPPPLRHLPAAPWRGGKLFLPVVKTILIHAGQGHGNRLVVRFKPREHRRVRELQSADSRVDCRTRRDAGSRPRCSRSHSASRC